MALKDELQLSVTQIFGARWSKREGRVVPEPKDLALGNDAVALDATILYADMADSTKLVDGNSAEVAAEVYKAYMECAAQIIKVQGGTITAYDGDRVMAVFIGDSQANMSVRAALKIRWAVSNVVNPALKAQYGSKAYQVNHTIGIDASEIMVSRIGVRNDNDLVWVGRAANHAAKLSSLTEGYTYITADVFRAIDHNNKFGGNPKQLIWEERVWKAMNDTTIYRSSWNAPL